MSETRKNLNFIDSRGSATTDPLRVFRFRASFKPVGGGTAFDPAITSFSGGFSAINGLNAQVQPITYREGGYNTTQHQIPGMASFSPVTMTRGMLYGNDSAITWMRGLFAVTSGQGLAVGSTRTNGYRCNVTIQLMDHPNAASPKNAPRVGFYLHNAWIQALNYSDLNAGNNELMFETMTLVHEGLSIAMLNADGTAATGSVKPIGFI
jgi:phage tail-like protein